MKRKLLLRRIVGVASLVVLTGLLGLAIINKQYIQDEIRLRNYQPTALVELLVEQTTMTTDAKRLFYINKPSVDQKTVFVEACNAKREQTIVLGCYHSGQSGIYILDVDDARLEGVEAVTAAHEMLHAAYERLSSSERSSVDAMLQDYYDNQLNDDRIMRTIDGYRQTEPNDLLNEMHSIFATEISSLPAQLEKYYSQYFTNRQAITTTASAYQAEFTSRQAKVAEYDKQLSAWLIQIESERTYLANESAAINQQRSQMEYLKAGGNNAAYNASVPAYNRRVTAYNNRVIAQQNLVNDYNDMVILRNNLQLEVDQLVQSINSNEIPETL